MHVLACSSQVFRFTFSCKLELASYRISVSHLACGNFQNLLVNDICRTFNMQLWIIYSCSYLWYKISQLFFAYEANLSFSILTSYHFILKDLFLSVLPFLSSPMSKSHEIDTFPTWNGVRSKAFHCLLLNLLWSSCLCCLIFNAVLGLTIFLLCILF